MSCAHGEPLRPLNGDENGTTEDRRLLSWFEILAALRWVAFLGEISNLLSLWVLPSICLLYWCPLHCAVVLCGSFEDLSFMV